MNLNTIKNSIVNFIDKNNTTTSSYDVSAGLKFRVITIENSSIKNPLPNIKFPAVLIDIKNNRPEIQTLGRSAFRKYVFDVEINGLINYGMGQTSGDIKGRDLSIIEMTRLSNNIENLLNHNISISSTVDMSVIKSIDYDKEINNNTWQSAFTINLECTKWS